MSHGEMFLSILLVLICSAVIYVAVGKWDIRDTRVYRIGDRKSLYEGFMADELIVLADRRELVTDVEKRYRQWLAMNKIPEEQIRGALFVLNESLHRGRLGGYEWFFGVVLREV